jgi:hypothetical protein
MRRFQWNSSTVRSVVPWTKRKKRIQKWNRKKMQSCRGAARILGKGFGKVPRKQRCSKYSPQYPEERGLKGHRNRHCSAWQAPSFKEAGDRPYFENTGGISEILADVYAKPTE